MKQELSAVIGEIEKVISGKDEVVRKTLAAMLAGGHILLDDVPGVGKTTLAVTLGRVMSLAFRRVQFTPDVLPSDISGYTLYNKETGAFEYRPGAVTDANLLLGDEINRASSRTQSALLEAMEENQVTVDGQTHPLPRPFIVIATQNNVGTAGTQPLPYAQMDRFMVRLTLGYPDRDAQIELLRRRQNANPLSEARPVVTLEAFRHMQAEVEAVAAKDCILDYIARLVMATRAHSSAAMGVSPRGALFIDRMAKARAYMEDRAFVIPEDVQAVFCDVAAHRLILTPAARLSGAEPRAVLDEVLATVPSPDWDGAA